jgi:hypothetical protein
MSPGVEHTSIDLVIGTDKIKAELPAREVRTYILLFAYKGISDEKGELWAGPE